jgi:hypothetical protein
VAAVRGSDFVRAVRGKSPGQRQALAYDALTSGALPHWLMRWVPVAYEARDGDGRTRSVVVRVLPDYLAVGDDGNYVRVPLFPTTAQRVADHYGAALPTPKLVRQVRAAAAAKLWAHPTGTRPKEAIETVAWASGTADEDLRSLGLAPGVLAAGHRKDIVVARALGAHPRSVLIYGWWSKGGGVIQGEPLFTGHSNAYEDYSHGVRLVDGTVDIDGAPHDYHQALASPLLAPLLSDEGVVSPSRYPVPEEPATDRIGGGGGASGAAAVALLAFGGCLLAAAGIYWRASLFSS